MLYRDGLLSHHILCIVWAENLVDVVEWTSCHLSAHVWSSLENSDKVVQVDLYISVPGYDISHQGVVACSSSVGQGLVNKKTLL